MQNEKGDREAFESHQQFSYLDFDRDNDAWRRGRYKHSHIQALWEGWQAALAWERSRQQPVDDEAFEGLMNAESNAFNEALPFTAAVAYEAVSPHLHSSQVQQASEWRPIETAPRDGTRVLLTDGKTVEAGSWKDTSYAIEEFVNEKKNGNKLYRQVRHVEGYWNSDLLPAYWQPLPAPPLSASEEV